MRSCVHNYGARRKRRSVSVELDARSKIRPAEILSTAEPISQHSCASAADHAAARGGERLQHLTGSPINSKPPRSEGSREVLRHYPNLFHPRPRKSCRIVFPPWRAVCRLYFSGTRRLPFCTAHSICFARERGQPRTACGRIPGSSCSFVVARFHYDLAATPGIRRRDDKRLRTCCAVHKKWATGPRTKDPAATSPAGPFHRNNIWRGRRRAYVARDGSGVLRFPPRAGRRTPTSFSW